MTKTTRLTCATLGGVIALAMACTSRGEPPPPLASHDAKAKHARPAKHAGTWYSADPKALRQELEGYFVSYTPNSKAYPIIAMIGPHAGVRYSGKIAAAGYAALRSQRVGRVFLLGPSHRMGFSGVALPDPELTAYDTPLGALAFDQAAIKALRGQPGFSGPAQAHADEHSLELHAIFIAAVQPKAKLVPLCVGQLGDDASVRAVASRLRALLRPDDVVIISSDFTHYGPSFGFVPFRDNVAERLDDLMNQAYAAIAARDLGAFSAYLDKTKDTICGRDPIRVLLAMLDTVAPVQQLARDTSGRMTGDFDNSVSYLDVVFRRPDGWPVSAPASAGPKDATMPDATTTETQAQAQAQVSHTPGPQVLDAAGQALALQLARKTIETYLRQGQTLSDAALGVPASGAWRTDYGVFVTLTKGGELRGCIGHIEAIQPLWQDIRDNAIAAAVHDPRFSPVSAAELDALHIEISILTHPTKVSGPEEIIVGRHGIVLGARGRRATFLPQVATEQHWDRETTLSHLARKAGLPSDIWLTREVELSVYEAQVFGEPTK